MIIYLISSLLISACSAYGAAMLAAAIFFDDQPSHEMLHVTAICMVCVQIILSSLSLASARFTLGYIFGLYYDASHISNIFEKTAKKEINNIVRKSPSSACSSKEFKFRDDKVKVSRFETESKEPFKVIETESGSKILTKKMQKI